MLTQVKHQLVQFRLKLLSEKILAKTWRGLDMALRNRTWLHAHERICLRNIKRLHVFGAGVS